VLALDRTRTDMECVEPDSAPVVVVEAKLGAVLTVTQLRRYAADQRRRLLDAGRSQGLLVALVPEARRSEAAERLGEVDHLADASLSEPHLSLRTAVWTFDDVFTQIRQSAIDDADIEQLAALVAATAALDVRPFTASELIEPAPRLEDLVKVADRLSAVLTPVGTKLMPGATNDPDFAWRRYVNAAPAESWVAIGVRRHQVGSGPLWLRVHRDTPHYTAASHRLRAHEATAELDKSGHTWAPLLVPTGVGGAEIVEQLANRAQRLIDIVADHPSRETPDP
jgi:hypothetical protein